MKENVIQLDEQEALTDEYSSKDGFKIVSNLH